MGYVGEEVDPDAGPDTSGEGPDPWVNRLEWAPDERAVAMVRDTAARLGILAGDAWWVATTAGPVRVVVETPRPGRNECGRPGGIAVALGGDVARLEPGVHYAARDSAAVAAIRILAPGGAAGAPADAVAALDYEGDGRPDAFLTPFALVEPRAPGRAYIARDPSAGRC